MERSASIQDIRNEIAKKTQLYLTRLRRQLWRREITKEEYSNRLRALKAMAKMGKEEYP